MQEDLKALLELVKETMQKHDIHYCAIGFVNGWTTIDTQKENQAGYSSISLKENGEFSEP